MSTCVQAFYNTGLDERDEEHKKNRQNIRLGCVLAEGHPTCDQPGRTKKALWQPSAGEGNLLTAVTTGFLIIASS